MRMKVKQVKDLRTLLSSKINKKGDQKNVVIVVLESNLMDLGCLVFGTGFVSIFCVANS